jgi:hypothetical protein
MGKPAVGTITLKAYHAKEMAYLEISDDGEGLFSQGNRARSILIDCITEEASEIPEGKLVKLTENWYFRQRGISFEVQNVCHEGTTVRFGLPLPQYFQ